MSLQAFINSYAKEKVTYEKSLGMDSLGDCKYTVPEDIEALYIDKYGRDTKDGKVENNNSKDSYFLTTSAVKVGDKIAGYKVIKIVNIKGFDGSVIGYKGFIQT